MSVRAYKIIEIKIEKEPSFNCWHDNRIMEIARLDCYNEGGTIEIFKDDAERLLKEIERELKSLSGEGDQEELNRLASACRKIIADCKDDDCVLYHCY